jgi:hypothetical protein
MDAKKYRICVLLRLHINTTVIGNFMGIDKSYVSRLSRDILKNVFQINGASKELAEKLNGIV